MLTPFPMRKALVPLSLLAGLVLAGHVPANPQSAGQSQVAQFLKALQAAQKAVQAQMAQAQKAAQAQAKQIQQTEKAAQKAANSQAAQMQKAQNTIQKVANTQAVQAQRAQKAIQKAEKVQRGAALGQVVAELHATKVLLESADRDYDGHRSAAVKELSAAIQELGGHTKGQGPPAKVEPQTLSDRHLKAAILQLAAIEEQLSTVPTPRGVKATTAVGTAVKELKKALTVR
jgi:DNA repair exonuclease SbcCD ATPase subunit